MIDTRRWILAEAWLTLGLKIRWAWGAHEAKPDIEIQEDDETRLRYWYTGHGEWAVIKPQRGYGDRSTEFEVPYFGTDTLKHELAHYLAATGDERNEVNFGLPKSDPNEDRCALAEKVVDAILRPCGRIAAMAMGGSR